MADRVPASFEVCDQLRLEHTVPGRAHGGRSDRRLPLDFDRRTVDPDVEHPDWPRAAASEAGEAR
jgi:hypothetical protein